MPEASWQLNIMPHNFRCGAFDCGDPFINGALRGELLSAIRQGRSRGYSVEEDGACLGFIALRAESFELGDSIDREEYALKSRTAPGVLLELIAVDQRVKGTGLGRWLLLAALPLAQRTAELIGARFLVLDSVPESTGFCAKMGFRQTLSQPSRGTVLEQFSK